MPRARHFVLLTVTPFDYHNHHVGEAVRRPGYRTLALAADSEGRIAMRWIPPALAFVVFLAAGAARGSEKNEPPFALSDESVLKNAGVPTDNAGLLEFFRKRTMTSQDQNKV